MPISVSTALAELLNNPTGTHRHKCPDKDCGTVWEHGDSCRNDEAAHRCPNCGAVQWIKQTDPGGDQWPLVVTPTAEQMLSQVDGSPVSAAVEILRARGHNVARRMWPLWPFPGRYDLDGRELTERQVIDLARDPYPDCLCDVPGERGCCERQAPEA